MSELRRTGTTRFNLEAAGAGAGAEDSLLAAVRATAAPDYEVLGEVARGPRDGAVLFLARAAQGGTLVALRLTSGPTPQEFQLELIRQLNRSLPAPEATCAHCGAVLLDWARFCGKCGAPVWGEAGPHTTPRAREDLRAAVEDAAAGRYEILGEMEHGDGPGIVYFARDLRTGRIEALRVRPEGEAEYSIGKTNVLRRLSVSVEAASVPRPPQRRAGPPPQAAPIPASAAASARPAARPAVAPPPKARSPSGAPAPRRPRAVSTPPTRRSLHLPISHVPVPDLPPIVWVLIGAVLLAILLLILIA